MPNNWKIEARVRNRIIEWNYDAMRDAKRAWSHLQKARTTIDTNDPVAAATLRTPAGLFYLDEAVTWR
jgi:hypothetical protein